MQNRDVSGSCNEDGGRLEELTSMIAGQARRCAGVALGIMRWRECRICMVG